MTSGEPARSAGAVLRPFRGLRYDPTRVDLAAVTTDPLDPVDTVGVAATLARDPHNVTWLIEPLLGGPATASPPGAVSRRLSTWRDQNVVRHDRRPCLYVYRYRGARGTMLGLVGAVPLVPAGNPRILPHERVNDAVVERHVALLDATRAQPEPVILVHEESPTVRVLLARVASSAPAVTFATRSATHPSSDVEHSLWLVDDPARQLDLDAALAGRALLIADGHHRQAAFARYAAQHRSAASPHGPWDFGLAMLVDAGDPGLWLGSVHRVVPDLSWVTVTETPGLETRALPDAASADRFLDRAEPDGCFVVTDGRTWLAAWPSRLPPARDGTRFTVRNFDDEWLRSWGVPGGTAAHGPDGALAIAAAERTGGLAILLPAPELSCVFDAARRGRLLPPKSTAFGPKPRVGLVLRHWPAGLDDLTAAPATGVSVPATAASPSAPRSPRG